MALCMSGRRNGKEQRVTLGACLIKFCTGKYITEEPDVVIPHVRIRVGQLNNCLFYHIDLQKMPYLDPC